MELVLTDNKIAAKDRADARTTASGILWVVLRVLAVIMIVAAFVSDLNPGRITTEISRHVSLFTTAVSRSKITETILRPIDRGDITEFTITLLMCASIAMLIGILLIGVGAGMSLGGKRVKRRAIWLPAIGSLLMAGGLIGLKFAYDAVLEKNVSSVPPNDTTIGFYVFMGLAALTALVAAALIIITLTKKAETECVRKEDLRIAEKYKLFLYLTPVILLTLLFNYLPLYGWRYAFFDYSPGVDLTFNSFVGFKWFKILFENPATRGDILLVLRNTFAMSGLGIASSILPIAFAVFFSEIKNNRLRKFIQTFCTLPNFISWVLIYAFAFALFETNGLLNALTGNDTNHLAQGGTGIWFSMLTWGVWKGLGWSAIIYIAAITGIDQQMYEAASIDGAKRFRKMWSITLPALMPTFSVMLLLSFAGILSNGLEQYLVFRNEVNAEYIRVLDLFVYQLGQGANGEQAQIPLATVISMMKSLISVVLLLIANRVSKAIRGESII